MLKKSIASILAAGMTLITVPLNVMAKDSLSLKSYNITTSVIIVNFKGVSENSAIDTDTLKENIEIERFSKGAVCEKLTDFEIFVQKETTDTAEANTVIIKPNGGISEEGIYRVTLKPGICDTDGVSLENKATTGWIAADVLFSDDFNVTYEADGVTPVYPYYIETESTKNDNGAVKSHFWNASYRKEFTTISNGYHSATELTKFQMRNNSQYMRLNTTGLPENKRVSDYTVEAEFGLPRGYNGFQGAYIRNQENVSNGYGLRFLNGNYTNKTANLEFYADSTKLGAINAYRLNDSIVNLRLSAIGNNIQYYIDNDKVYDGTDASITRAGGAAFIGGSVYNQTPHVTVDNVVITQMKEYADNLPEITVNSSSVSEEAVTKIEFSKEIDKDYAEQYITLSGNGEKIDTAIEVEGRTISIKPINNLSDGEYLITLNKGISAEDLSVLMSVYQVAFNVTDGTAKALEITKPELSNVSANVLNEEFTMTFDYNGENDNNSEYYIYASDKADGEFLEIESGVLTDEELIINAGEAFTDCYLKVKVIPKDSKGYLNEEYETDAFKGMFTPVIKSVSVDDHFEEGYVAVTSYDFYDENGDNDLTEICWYSSDDIDGEYLPIGGANDKKLIIDEKLRDRFVKVYVTPAANTYPYKGEPYISTNYCRRYEPQALDVKIAGAAELGAVLAGEYTYFDKNHESESGTTYRWLTSDSENGEYTAIAEATGTEYTISDKDIGKFLKFEVTPRKNEKAGTAALSGAFACPAKPKAKNVAISGTLKAGYTVTGVYDYEQVNNVEEGESLYTWYVGNTAAGHEKTYTIKEADAGKTLYFEVTPVAKQEPSVGDAQKSSGVTIQKGSSGGSSGSSSGGNTRVPSGIGSGSVLGAIQNNIDKLTENPAEFITSFTDINESSYKKEIVELFDRGIIKGVSETEFVPQREITRAEFVTLMVRFLQLPESSYTGVFADVDADSWYANNVQTGYNSGLIEGYDGEFRPQDSIKLEEILKILVRAYEKNGENIEVEDEAKSFDNVSDWAAEYVIKAEKLKLIKDNDEFVLNTYAVREQAAALVYRYVEKVGGIK